MPGKVPGVKKAISKRKVLKNHEGEGGYDYENKFSEVVKHLGPEGSAKYMRRGSARMRRV